MGLRYTSYRLCHEIEKRLGFLKKKHPTQPLVKSYISLVGWRKLETPFIIGTRDVLHFPKRKEAVLKKSAHKILSGEICFFSSEWKNLGLDYDWITNPETSYKYDVTKHWSKINDFNPDNGDIKYVWEKSRFSHLLTIIRYDYNFNEDHSVFVFSEIESWIDANPINQGPNWKCSQEISLRLLNWMYVLTFYKKSDALTEVLWLKIQHTIYWSLHHVYEHINFSRIAVRNNHAITETLFLAVSDLLFPFISETKKWAKSGRKWLEVEVDYQVYEDGTFLQFSMNYHRVLIQLFSFMINLTELHKVPLSKNLKRKAYNSLNFLFQCQDEKSGKLPNYGANDGALFFNFSNATFRDYRPQLNTLHYTLTGADLYENEYLFESKSWFGENSVNEKFKPLVKKQGLLSFNDGGYYLIREKDSFSFLRAGNHLDRPSQADNLHLDLWINGVNVLIDAGTFKYNTDEDSLNYFVGTASHNTVMINRGNQMLKGSRFIWYYWSQVQDVVLNETETEFIIDVKAKVYQYLEKGLIHQRRLLKDKRSHKWTVIDMIHSKNNFISKQIWHTPKNVNLAFSSSSENAPINEYSESWYSSEYGHKELGSQINMAFQNKIITTIVQK